MGEWAVMVTTEICRRLWKFSTVDVVSLCVCTRICKMFRTVQFSDLNHNRIAMGTTRRLIEAHRSELDRLRFSNPIHSKSLQLNSIRPSYLLHSQTIASFLPHHASTSSIFTFTSSSSSSSSSSSFLTPPHSIPSNCPTSTSKSSYSWNHSTYFSSATPSGHVWSCLMCQSPAPLCV